MTSRWPPLEESAPPRLLTPSSPAQSDAPPAPPIELGTVVADKYRVERVIGFGGMGMVFAAQHLELGTLVAVKLVRPERAADERATARFLSEARAAAQLQSQYACRVMDCGRLPSGSPYIVMEYLTGQDLRTGIDQRGPLEIEQTVLLVLHACEALAEAHAKHIVHRDVKPENLFVAEGPGGTPVLKVLDFGISKQLSPLLSQRSLTDSTESMGSPFHMSPEQMLDPSSVDLRTDIWSLGVVLYEALTGQMPFSGETGPQLCANVMTTDPIPPWAHRHEIPEGLGRVILRCLEKDKAKRYADVGELAVALREFGGAAAVMAAARVEQILGREGELEPPRSWRAAPQDEKGIEPHEVIDSIPGVPRRGLARRASVGLVLLFATALAVWGVKRAVTRPRSEPLPTNAPSAVALPEPPPAPSLPAPSESGVARPGRKPKRALTPAAHPAAPVQHTAPERTAPSPPGASPPPAVNPSPAGDASGTAVYPQLTPLPELATPEPE